MGINMGWAEQHKNHDCASDGFGLNPKAHFMSTERAKRCAGTTACAPVFIHNIIFVLRRHAQKEGQSLKQTNKLHQSWKWQPWLLFRPPSPLFLSPQTLSLATASFLLHPLFRYLLLPMLLCFGFGIFSKNSSRSWTRYWLFSIGFLLVCWICSLLGKLFVFCVEIIYGFFSKMKLLFVIIIFASKEAPFGLFWEIWSK